MNDSESEYTTMDGDDDGFGSWHTTGKRFATQVEKTNVIIKAQEALTNEGFMIIMKPTHVGRRFYMVNIIPELDQTAFLSSMIYSYFLFRVCAGSPCCMGGSISPER